MTLENYKLLKDKTTLPVEGEIRYKRWTAKKTGKERLNFFQWTNGEWKYYPMPEEFRKELGEPVGTIKEDRDRNGELINLRQKQEDGSWKYLPKPEEYRKKLGTPGLPDGSIREVGTRTYEKQNGEWVLIKKRSRMREHEIGTIVERKVGDRSIKKIKTEDGWKTVYKDKSEYIVPENTPIGKYGPRPELRKLVYGVGVNDIMIPEFTKTRIWKTWAGIIRRTDNRDPVWLSYKQSYIGCTLDPSWYVLSVFKEWVEQWEDHENKECDKDILIPGNKLYGPDTCLMVRPIVNRWFKPNQNSNSTLPRGVTKAKEECTKPYRAQIQPIDGKKKALGYFWTPEEANAAYEEARREQVQILIDTETDPRVKAALINRLEND